MKITGIIRPTAGNREFSREAWCALITERPEFRRRAPLSAPNPFKPGTMMTVPYPDDGAEVVVDGQVVGSVGWSMSEERFAMIEVGQSAVPLVLQWAKGYGGEFTEESWK